MDIVLRSEALINELEGEAKRGQGNRRDLTSGPIGPKVDKGRTSTKIAEMTGTFEPSESKEPNG